MKQFILISMLAAILLTACEKKGSCNEATINKTAQPCVTWGITKDGVTYQAESLPDAFKEEGLKVCVQYELITSPASCACCGTKARITSISRSPD